VDAMRELDTMASKAAEIVEPMREAILKREEDPMPKARERERELNDLRTEFRQSHIERLSGGKCTATAGILFLDMLTSFEKLGDHAYNVLEATVGIK
ncbi:MAG: PhoU domain-containing protein, partial [Deltaproteobacteria bacterium]|nr:PhoU domain-containing protein [Deltaproteobacteria bacterium]